MQKPKRKTSRTAPRRRRKSSGKRVPVIKLRWWSVAIIVALLALMICRPMLQRTFGEHGASVPSSVRGDYGIDISHNNRGTIVWDSLMVMTDRSGRTVHNIRQAKEIVPVSFVFIKATEGQSMTDRRFKEYWKAAADHGIQRGAYHFYRTSKDPVKQAKSFIKTVGTIRHGDLPPVLDIETTHKGLNKDKLNKDLLSWLQTVETHYGRKPIVYTYESFAKEWLSKEITDNYPIWIAHYRTQSPDRDDWQFWQFTDRALVYGVEYPVDLSLRNPADLSLRRR